MCCVWTHLVHLVSLCGSVFSWPDPPHLHPHLAGESCREMWGKWRTVWDSRHTCEPSTPASPLFAEPLWWPYRSHREKQRKRGEKAQSCSIIGFYLSIYKKIKENLSRLFRDLIFEKRNFQRVTQRGLDFKIKTQLSFFAAANSVTGLPRTQSKSLWVRQRQTVPFECNWLDAAGK